MVSAWLRLNGKYTHLRCIHWDRCHLWNVCDQRPIVSDVRDEEMQGGIVGIYRASAFNGRSGRDLLEIVTEVGLTHSCFAKRYQYGKKKREGEKKGFLSTYLSSELSGLRGTTQARPAVEPGPTPSLHPCRLTRVRG